MSTLLTSFGTGVSGLHVAQTGLNTAAHNIANTDTVGYVRQQVIVTDHVYDTRFDRNNGFAQTGLGTHVSLILQRRSEFLINSTGKRQEDLASITSDLKLFWRCRICLGNLIMNHFHRI